jgi:hypothetical protein
VGVDGYSLTVTRGHRHTLLSQQMGTSKGGVVYRRRRLQDETALVVRTWTVEEGAVGLVVARLLAVQTMACIPCVREGPRV